MVHENSGSITVTSGRVSNSSAERNIPNIRLGLYKQASMLTAVGEQWRSSQASCSQSRVILSLIPSLLHSTVAGQRILRSRFEPLGRSCSLGFSGLVDGIPTRRAAAAFPDRTHSSNRLCETFMGTSNPAFVSIRVLSIAPSVFITIASYPSYKMRGVAVRSWGLGR